MRAPLTTAGGQIGEGGEHGIRFVASTVAPGTARSARCRPHSADRAVEILALSMHLEPFDWERFAELFSRALLFVLFVMPFSPKLTNMDVAAQAADHRIFPVGPSVMFAATPYPNGVLRDRVAQAEGGPHLGAVDSVRGR